MTTVSDENGIMNNFAKEPAMYYAEAPNGKEKRGYLVWGVVALVVVAGSIFTATLVS